MKWDKTRAFESLAIFYLLCLFGSLAITSVSFGLHCKVTNDDFYVKAMFPGLRQTTNAMCSKERLSAVEREWQKKVGDLPRIPYNQWFSDLADGLVTFVEWEELVRGGYIREARVILTYKNNSKVVGDVPRAENNEWYLLRNMVQNKNFANTSGVTNISSRTYSSRDGFAEWVARNTSNAILYFLMIAMLAVMIFMLRSMFSVTKYPLRIVPKTNETFDDVGGATDAKQEGLLIIDKLKNPHIYLAMGGKIKGAVLFKGAPGTGKTLLVRVIANQANVPCFKIDCPELVKLFPGAAASRVKHIFLQARKRAPCILFFDEIDVIGKKRIEGTSESKEEKESALTTLLTAMDGFEQSDKPVFVIFATNRPETLDHALLRAERIDAEITFSHPELEDRCAIAEIHAKGKAIPQDTKAEWMKKIAHTTPGFSGADIRFMWEDAANRAAYLRHDFIKLEDVEYAIARIYAKEQNKLNVS